jgi:prepilin-type N-terminal cleavage/methylation domain-containing protein
MIALPPARPPQAGPPAQAGRRQAPKPPRRLRLRVSPRGRRLSSRLSLHGFTLIELLVVIAIIALLLTLLTPSLRQAQDLARKAICASDLHGLGHAAGVFYGAHRKLWPFVNTTGDWTQETYASPASMLLPDENGRGPHFLDSPEALWCPLYPHVSFDVDWVRWADRKAQSYTVEGDVFGTTYAWLYPRVASWDDEFQGKPVDPWGYRPEVTCVDADTHNSSLGDVPDACRELLMIDQPLPTMGVGPQSVPHFNALFRDGSVQQVAESVEEAELWLGM